MEMIMSPSSVIVTPPAKNPEEQANKKEKEERFKKQKRNGKQDNPGEDSADNYFKNLTKHGFEFYVDEMRTNGIHHRRRLSEKITLRNIEKIKNPAFGARFVIILFIFWWSTAAPPHFLPEFQPVLIGHFLPFIFPG
jgi:hypothetical protein